MSPGRVIAVRSGSEEGRSAVRAGEGLAEEGGLRGGGVRGGDRAGLDPVALRLDRDVAQEEHRLERVGVDATSVGQDTERVAEVVREREALVALVLREVEGRAEQARVAARGGR